MAECRNAVVRRSSRTKVLDRRKSTHSDPSGIGITNRYYAIRHTEYDAERLGGAYRGRVDLMIDTSEGTTVVEFKYLPRPRNGPETGPIYLGSFLPGTYRPGILTSGSQVQLGLQLLVSDAGFLGYLQRTTTRLGLAQYQASEPTPYRLMLTPSGGNSFLPEAIRKRFRIYENSWDRKQPNDGT